MKKNGISFKGYLICVLILASILCSTSAYGVTTVLLVRHADRANDHLSIEGWVRAKALAHVAYKAGVTAIYATEYTRTQQTVQPLAELLGLEPTIYNSLSLSNLASNILSAHEGEVVLVAGHSNTVLQIASYLGADITVQDTNEFDNLYLVTCGDGETNIVNLQYGESSDYDVFESSSCEMTTLLLVRDEAEGGDSGQRAEKLAHAAKKTGVTAIYTTATNQTVADLADELSISENTDYGSGQITNLIDDVMVNHAGEVVVVSGENDTLLGIIDELGGSPIPSFDDNEYDNLFVVTVYDSETPAASVINLQYGAPSPAENISVVHVIDRTGSMGTYGYMEPAKTAGQNFISLMEPGDEVGVAAFNDEGCDDEEPKAETVFALSEITDETVIDAAIDAIEPLDARGCTSIGAGMQLAQSDFLDQAIGDHPHGMVLLTDGFENTPPWVEEILPTIPDTTDIYTIALGPTADTDLMQEIKNETGGEFYESPDTGDLLSIYYQILGNLELKEMADLKKGVKGGGNDTRTVTIDTDASEAIFVLGWLQERGRLKLTLKDPKGDKVTPGALGVKIGSDSTYYFIRIKNPLAGDWEVHILRTDSGTFQIDYTFAAFVKGVSKLGYFSPGFTYAGDCLLTKIRVYDSSTLKPIKGASVKALISSPHISKYTLNYNYLRPTCPRWNPSSIMSPKPKNPIGKISASNIANADKPPAWVSTLRYYDQKSIKETGKSIFQYDIREIMLTDDGTHGDEKAGDGFYTFCMEQTQIAGPYNIGFAISGVTPAGANFKRRLVSTAVIMPGQVNAEKTLVRVDPSVIDIDEGSEGVVTIVPMDRCGNVWGPGFASKIFVSTPVGILHGNVIDNGDGFYFQKLKSMGEEQTGRITVTIDGIEMKSKPLVAFKKPGSASIHAGITIPTGTFRSRCDSGYHLGFDVDYHVAPRLSLIGLVGYNHFDSGPFSKSDTHWWNISANLKYEFTPPPLKLYINGGPGFYFPRSGTIRLGFNVGLGLGYAFSPGWTLELGGDYHHIFGSGREPEFFVPHIALVYRF